MLCVILVAAACGKRGESGSAAGGTAVGSGSAVLTLPKDTDVPAGLSVTVKPSGELPEAVRRYTLTLAAHYEVVAVVEVGPPTAKLAAPSQLAITIDPTRIQKGRTPADVTAVQLQAENKLVDLPVRVFGPQRIDVTIDQPGIVMLMGPLENLTVLGPTSQVVRGASELSTRGDCGSWITATSPGIAALAKDPAGLVIGPDHTIQLGTKLEAGGRSPELLHADQILARGVADPDEASLVLASALLAQGHPVRLVSGSIEFTAAGAKTSGVVQWAEVVLDGAPWFVDAREVSKPKLLPLAEATASLGLVLRRSCAAYPPGASSAPEQWVPGPATPPAPPGTPATPSK